VQETYNWFQQHRRCLFNLSKRTPHTLNRSPGPSPSPINENHFTRFWWMF
jgi:hypothetical protein